MRLSTNKDIALVMLMTAAYHASGDNLPVRIMTHWAYNLTDFFVNMDGYYFVANAILFVLAALLTAIITFVFSRLWL